MRGSVNIKVRPTKLALLVDPHDTSQVRAAIQLASSLWGGMYFPIIPLYKRMPKSWRNPPLATPRARDVVKGYLEAFDPDLLVQFSDNLPTYISDTRLPTIRPQDVWKPTRLNDDSSYGIGVFALLDDIYKTYFRYKAKYPARVVIPTLPETNALFWASFLGDYDQEILSAILKGYGDALEIERTAASVEDLENILDSSVCFPRRITSWGTTQHGDLSFRHEASLFFMDASKTGDVIDFWNLRAAGWQVLPLPKQFTSVPPFNAFIEDFIKSNRRVWPHDPKHFEVVKFICSRHCSFKEMESYARTLNVVEQKVEANPEPQYSLQHWYPRLWDEWSRGRDGGVADVYGEGEQSLDTETTDKLRIDLKPLLPKFLQRDWFYAEALCANEIEFSLYGADEYLAEVYPSNHGAKVARVIEGFGGLGNEWRVGHHGLVRLVRNKITAQRTVPSSESIFFAWLEDQGWQAELSAPGILAKQIFKRLAGYPKILANKSVLNLIEYMNGGGSSKNGAFGEEPRSGAPRELAVGEVKSRLGGPEKNAALYNSLLEKGVFHLGLQTQCPTCQRRTWFALSAVKESMECPKCLTTFPAAGNIDQTSGAWYYRTAGPFSVPNLADGAYAVLLTIDKLADHMLGLNRTTAVPSFVAKSADKEDLEADLAMFWTEARYGERTEGVLFGECKSFGPFAKKDIDRMRYLGSMFPGAVLVFSTLRTELNAKEISAIGRLAKKGRKYWKAERPVNPILILTGNELLHWQHPPYCWSKDIRDRFNHIDGLLSLCDATQQIYLNLPPIRKDWEERWNRRRARAMARTNKAPSGG